MVKFGNNFGKQFNAGKGFSDKTAKKLGNSGVSDITGFQTFLNSQGANVNKHNIGSYINRFNNPTPQAPVIADAVNTKPIESAAVAQTQAGQDAMAGGNSKFSDILAGNAQQAGMNSQGLYNDIGNARYLANQQGAAALDPRLGRGMNDTLNRFRQEGLDYNNQAFSAGGPEASDFANRLQQERTNQFATGLVGAKSGAAREGKLFSDLQDRKAAADFAVMSQNNTQRLGQLDQQRQANLGLSQQFEGRANANLQGAQGFANTGVSANTSGGQVDLGNRQLGADIFNSGINNQWKGAGFNADIAQRDFDNQQGQFTLNEQVAQQDRENRIGDASRRFDRQMIQDMMNGMYSGGRGFGQRALNTFVPFSNWFGG